MHATRADNVTLDSNVCKLCCATNAGSAGVSQWEATHAVIPAMAEDKTCDWHLKKYSCATCLHIAAIYFHLLSSVHLN